MLFEVVINKFTSFYIDSTFINHNNSYTVIKVTKCTMFSLI